MGNSGVLMALAVCIGWEGESRGDQGEMCPVALESAGGPTRAALGRTQPVVQQVAGTCSRDGAGVLLPS